MKIIVPHATSPYLINRGLRPEVKALLDGRAEFIDVSGSNHDYCDLLERLWAECVDEDLCIVEQDNLPTNSDLEGLAECAELWCACPYPGPEGPMKTGLGCTRFRAKLMRQTPDLFERMFERRGTRQWNGMDQAMEQELRSRGYEPHEHQEVGHLHDYSPEAEAAQERHLAEIARRNALA